MRAVLVLAALVLCGHHRVWADTFLILPFSNLSGNSNLDWIGESLAETLRESLVAQGVIALERDDRQEAYRRLSIRPYTQLTRASVIRLGELLDAGGVIYGSYELHGPEETSPKSRGSLRIAAHILDLRRVRRGPEYMEAGPLEELARLQRHLAWQTLQFVAPETTPSEKDYREQHPALRVDAIESYIRGLLAASPEQKFKLFAQAVQLEPRYSQANYQLGRLHLERDSYRLAASSFERVGASDVHHREATFLLGLCRYYLGEFPAAVQAFQAVAQDVPLNEVLNNLGAAQARLDSPSAMENFRKALEGDSSDPDYHFNVGYALFRRGDYEGAADRFRAVLDRAPDDAEAVTMLGRCLQKNPPRVDLKSEGLERLKEEYQESAYWQLKAVLESKR
jgi:tetratricopeptide (TPR) repeat protein